MTKATGERSMPEHGQEQLFAAVDALLAQPRDLPEPAERVRLREAAHLSRPEVAGALGVTPGTVAGWESGRSEPQGALRAAYARLLEGLAVRYPAPAPEQPAPAAERPVQASEAARVAPGPGVPVPGPHSAADGPSGPVTAAPVAPPTAVPPLVVEPDRERGELVTGPAEPCVLCGRPTPYRGGGRPQHMGGLCLTGMGTPPTELLDAGVQESSAAAAPVPVARSVPSVPVPARAERPREDSGGLIARNVAKALEDNGGDVEAALAVLVRRAVPDGMALLNSTRVGSTYDFTNYINTDDVPVLKKPSRDGADAIWEGRPKWRNRRVESGPARTVTALDVNGAYLSALKTHLPIGAPRHCATGEYDRKRSGVYLITPPEWAHEDLPSPLGNREEPGPLWVTDPTLRLLIRLSGPKVGLCAPPVIHESWTSGSSEALLERFRREMAAAREAAIESGDTVTLEYVKAMYSKFVSTIGESSANREMRRPDWMHIIRSQAFANLWLKAWKAHQAGLTLVRMMGTDELHVTGGDWRAVFTEGRKLTEVKLKNEYTIGSGN
ncbi:helix-turn-helix domain-containing protein [Streptomyces litchfieldiae]|uniref:Helix-turn-helix domain-containing protein n=1 Tax=Streptomyces litchfieldiae TaxID=3075543 RepID=A0ABU2N1A9_9ACTN|nr:helix-turn-helix domain-containing protein [Streptomyces sp. DSM 44938]MDT0347560.1 helix-turn-helix domain-containing protein [Streptomyces sp. DSM 44938]